MFNKCYLYSLYVTTDLIVNLGGIELRALSLLYIHQNNSCNAYQYILKIILQNISSTSNLAERFAENRNKYTQHRFSHVPGFEGIITVISHNMHPVGAALSYVKSLMWYFQLHDRCHVHLFKSGTAIIRELEVHTLAKGHHKFIKPVAYSVVLGMIIVDIGWLNIIDNC